MQSAKSSNIRSDSAFSWCYVRNFTPILVWVRLEQGICVLQSCIDLFCSRPSFILKMLCFKDSWKETVRLFFYHNGITYIQILYAG